MKNTIMRKKAIIMRRKNITDTAMKKAIITKRKSTTAMKKVIIMKKSITVTVMKTITIMTMERDTIIMNTAI